LKTHSGRLWTSIPEYDKAYRSSTQRIARECNLKDLLEPLRRQLDTAYRDIRESGILIADGQHPIAPVFAVARHPSISERTLNTGGTEPRKIKLPFTPHLLLSESQGELLESVSGDRLARTKVEETLKNNRSQADSPLLSGTTDLMERGGPRRSNGPAPALEKVLYEDMCKGSPYLFVPIHVGRIPWLCFFTVQGPGSQGQWLRTYHFYRDVLPHLIGTVTAGVYNSLAEALVSSAIGKCAKGDWRPALKDINAEWKTLAAHFPFIKSIVLHAPEGEPCVVAESLDQNDYLRIENNVSFASRIQSDLTKKIKCGGVNSAGSFILGRRLFLEHNNEYVVINTDKLVADGNQRWSEYEQAKEKVTALVTRIDSAANKKRMSSDAGLNGSLAAFLMAARAVVLVHTPIWKQEGIQPRSFVEAVAYLFKTSNGTSYLRNLLHQRESGASDLYTQWREAFESIKPWELESVHWEAFPKEWGFFIRRYIRELWKEEADKAAERRPGREGQGQGRRRREEGHGTEPVGPGSAGPGAPAVGRRGAH
jgi:hypothetical protein